jgi:poly-gamma-glutamate capsule biosynthesis protein CapA/YwtB (metallophosphatase superfamily)
MRSTRRRGYISPIRRLRPAALVAALCLIAVIAVVMVRCSRTDAQDQPALAPAGTPLPTAQPTPSAGPDAAGPESSVIPAEDLAIEVPEPSDAPLVAGAKRTAVIRSFGDIIIHEPLYTTARKNAQNTESTFDFSPYFSQIGDSIAAADYTVGNVDGPLGGRGSRGYRFYPQFNTPPHLLTALKEAGVDMLTLANNHALDTYLDGLKRTVDNVEKAEIEHIGAYRSQQEYDTPKVIEINGIRVGFTNYTVSTNNLENSSDPDAMVYGLRTTRNSSPTKDIAALREAGAEIVAVYMHWGEEYERKASASQKNLAQKLVAAGADIIIGGHPHVVQPIEEVRAKDADGNSRSALVVYSMGNFLSDQRARYRDSGIIFEFTLVDDGSGQVQITSPRYVPIYVWRTQGGGGYDYRVVACGDVIKQRPGSMDDETFNRVKQVWNELEQVIGDGASIARS